MQIHCRRCYRPLAREQNGSGGVCTITIADIEAVNGTHCPIFGKPYVIEKGHPDSRSLDKIFDRIYGTCAETLPSSRDVPTLIKQDATSSELHRVVSRLRSIEKGILSELQAGPLNDLIILKIKQRKGQAPHKDG